MVHGPWSMVHGPCTYDIYIYIVYVYIPQTDLCVGVLAAPASFCAQAADFVRFGSLPCTRNGRPCDFLQKNMMVLTHFTSWCLPRASWVPSGCLWMPSGCLWLPPCCLLDVSICIPRYASRCLEMLPDASQMPPQQCFHSNDSTTQIS